MKSFFASFALAGLLMASPAFACDPASNNNCVDQPCAPHGATMIQQDGKRLLACLKIDSGATVWRIMSTGVTADDTSTAGSCTYRAYAGAPVTTFSNKTAFYIATGAAPGIYQCLDGSLSYVYDTNPASMTR